MNPQVSTTADVVKERTCPRSDCEGWEGHITYVTGEHRAKLLVREQCAALAAFVKDGSHHHCWMEPGDMGDGYAEQENLVDP